MRKIKARENEKVYLFKVVVKGIYGGYGKPKENSYRVLAIPEGFTLYNLAESIVDSFNFYFDHSCRIISVFVSADNILDKQYEIMLGYPMSGREIFAGAEIKFLAGGDCDGEERNIGSIYNSSSVANTSNTCCWMW